MALFLINHNPVLFFLISHYLLNNITHQTLKEIGNNIGMKFGCGIASQHRCGRTPDNCTSPGGGGGAKLDGDDTTQKGIGRRTGL